MKPHTSFIPLANLYAMSVFSGPMPWKSSSVLDTYFLGVEVKTGAVTSSKQVLNNGRFVRHRNFCRRQDILESSAAATMRTHFSHTAQLALLGVIEGVEGTPRGEKGDMICSTSHFLDWHIRQQLDQMLLHALHVQSHRPLRISEGATGEDPAVSCEEESPGESITTFPFISTLRG